MFSVASFDVTIHTWLVLPVLCKFLLKVGTLESIISSASSLASSAQIESLGQEWWVRSPSSAGLQHLYLNP